MIIDHDLVDYQAPARRVMQEAKVPNDANGAP